MLSAAVRKPFIAGVIGAVVGSVSPTVDGATRGPQLQVDGVAREVRIDIPLPPKSPTPTAVPLPGGHALEIDLPVARDVVERALARVPTSFATRLQSVSTGTRLRIVHSGRRLRFVEGRRRNTYSLATGSESEDTRLREMATEVRHPLPQPRNLGAHLELWQEAERATARADLKQAMRLWEKLADEHSLRDLAGLRIAELYVISGHIEQATELLRQVSREYPRSSGAALARLDALRLEVITQQGSPTAEQVVIAAMSGNRQRFEPFAWLRATRVLIELDAADVALHNFPLLEQLPAHVRDDAKAARDALVSTAIGIPAAADRPFDTVVQYRAWSDYLRDHPEVDTIRRLVAEAHLAIGLFEHAIPLFRLALGKSGSETGEAATISALADAYLGAEDLPHALEVVRFQIANYPRAPDLPARVLALALLSREQQNVASARELLTNLRDQAKNRALKRAVVGIEVDFALAWGTAKEQVALLDTMRGIGFDDDRKRGSQLAMALARDGRFPRAVPLLRAQIGRATDPELRDEMTYLLARAEAELGHKDDARKLLESIATHSTHWGLVARSRLRERTLTDLVAHVERRNNSRREN
ncbi:MAG: hypothetical protein B7733_09480 [Myxococcales bacterium FL481]|nr:MAG: hypothetical protein B7733_09480 [Myxococcales bacterium FL481]